MAKELRRDLDAQVVVRAAAEGTDERIIEGIVIPWGQVATVRSVGEYKTPGTIYQETMVSGSTLGLDPARVTLEAIHHDGKLTGRGIEAEDRPEGLFMGLKVSRTDAGNELLELARDGVLTKFSVVFEPVKERIRHDGVVERTAINVLRVALLERGAYPDAQVSAVRSESISPQEKPMEKEFVTREEKAAHATELRQVLERMAIEYPGVLPSEAQAKWDDTTADLENTMADIAAWDARQSKLAEFVKRDSTEKPNVERGDSLQFFVRKTDADIYDMEQYRGYTREKGRLLMRDNAQRSVETTRFEHPAAEKRDAEIRGHIAYLLDTKDTEDGEIANRVLVTGDPVAKRTFRKLIQGKALTPEEQHRAAALQVVGTTTTGGYALPYTFDPTFIPTGAYTNINPYRGLFRVEQIAGSNNWQGVSVGNIAATYRAESAVVAEGGPTFARPSLTAQRCDAFVTLSRETLQDRPDIDAELASLINEGKETNEENQFSVGVGTTVFPQGVALSGAFTVKTTITNDTFAVADLDATEAALPIRHRRDAVWMFSRAVIRIIQGFETVNGKLFNSTLGYPAVGNIANNPGGNTNMNLLGYPVYETPSIPTTVTVDATVIGLLVNPSQYLILDRVGMAVELIPNMFDQATGLPNGNRGLFAMWRNTARVLNADGGRQVKIQ